MGKAALFVGADDVVAAEATTETVTIESRASISVRDGPRKGSRGKGADVMVGRGF